MSETITKERPILFSAPMIRAILAGTKTQTRRVIPEFRCLDPDDTHDRRKLVEWCKCGSVGDRLWVRESFALVSMYGVNYDISDAASRPHKTTVLYRADDGPRRYFSSEVEPVVMTDDDLRWRPSIHMPRWASRITLEITDVRVQRLWKISNSDARAEGIDLGDFRSQFEGIAGQEHIIAFSGLWDSINGNRPGAAWKDNPWVWAISFKVVK